MTEFEISKLIAACDRLSEKIVPHEGCIADSEEILTASIDAFHRSRIPAQAITFRVFFAAPVSSLGVATIERDGHLTLRRT